jgi:sortase A
MRPLFCSNRAKRSIQLAQHGFAAVGILAFGYCLTVYVNAEFFQARETSNFRRELHPREVVTGTSSSPIATLATPVDGAVIGQIEIPRLRLAVMVVEGVNDGDLKRAAGHIPGTALPGEPGNVGIAGHRDTFFRPLRWIRRNDTITLNTLQGAYRYRVVSTEVVRPEDIHVLYPTGHDSLTLVTCFPFDYIGSASKRLIVRAERTPGT